MALFLLKLNIIIQQSVSQSKLYRLFITMKKLNFILSAAALSATVLSNAQVKSTIADSDGRSITTRKEQSQAATGSMFVNEKFMPAKVSTYPTVVLLRYNAYADFFEMSNPQLQDVKALPKDATLEITFPSEDKKYVYTDFTKEDGSKQSGYLVVLSDNPKLKIYKKESVTMTAEYFPTNSYQSYKPANYKRGTDEFYVKVGDGEATFFDGKKDFAKLVPAKSKEVLDFIKSSKINLENATDLQKLGQYTNSIL